jgi:hypothetical protein
LEKVMPKNPMSLGLHADQQVNPSKFSVLSCLNKGWWEGKVVA